MSWTKLGVAALVIAAALIYWMTSTIWAASFLGVLFAVSFIGPAGWLRTKVRMPHWLAASAVMLVVLIAMAGLGWLIGPSLARQVEEMRTTLPKSVEQVVDWLDERPWGQRVVAQVESWSGMTPDTPSPADRVSAAAAEPPGTGTDASRASVDSAESDGLATDPNGGTVATGAGSEPSATSSISDHAPMVGSLVRSGVGIVNLTIETIALIILTIAMAIFIALDPTAYERGVIWLVPKAHEGTARKTMTRLAVALRWWMLGRLVSMLAIGVLTALGMWLIGMPVPIALGTLAGLLSFVPNIGPIVAAVPGILLALTLGPWMVVWALCVYLVAQAVESNAITPIVNQYAVSTPAAMVLVVQFVFAILGGVWGMLIATPALVVIMVLVQQLYVREGLKKPVEVIGSS